MNIILGTSVSEDHKHFGDSPPDTPLHSEDGVLHVFYGFAFKQTADWGGSLFQKNQTTKLQFPASPPERSAAEYEFLNAKSGE